MGVEHKRIGILYAMVGIWGGFFGLGLSMLMRLNFMDPYYNIVPVDIYNSLVTSHGISMIFFFLMPVLVGGFGNYLLPLFLSVLDLSLPRLNGLSLWLMFPSVLFLIVSVSRGTGCGWTFYPPLSRVGYSGAGVDFLMFSLHLAGLSSLFGSVNFVNTAYYSVEGFSCLRVSILV